MKKKFLKHRHLNTIVLLTAIIGSWQTVEALFDAKCTNNGTQQMVAVTQATKGGIAIGIYNQTLIQNCNAKASLSVKLPGVFGAIGQKYNWNLSNVPVTNLGKINKKQEPRIIELKKNERQVLSYKLTGKGLLQDATIQYLVVPFDLTQKTYSFELPATKKPESSLSEELQKLKNESPRKGDYLIKLYSRIGTQGLWEERQEFFSPIPQNKILKVTIFIDENGDIGVPFHRYKDDGTYETFLVDNKMMFSIAAPNP